jgi:MFS family permease
MASYMIMSPIIGFLTDRYNLQRKYGIVVGLLIMGVSTSLTGLCNSFVSILFPRIMFGIGVAIYGTLVPTFMSDFYEPSKRNIVLSIFFSATPIGCAIGYTVAGTLSYYVGWKLTFIYLGIPSILSIGLLFLREPVRGEKDTDEDSILINDKRVTLCNPTYIFAVAGYIAVTFGMGGFSDWLPTFFTRYHGLTVQMAGTINGIIVVAGGLTGALFGGIVSDLTRKYITARHPYFLVSGVSMLISAVSASLAMYMWQNLLSVVLAMFSLAVFFGWWFNGPINGIIQNCVPARLRTQANGVCALFIHLFGDAFSPSIIGLISDKTGGNLRGALMVVPISFAVSAVVWLIGWFAVSTPKVILQNMYKKIIDENTPINHVQDDVV